MGKRTIVGAVLVAAGFAAGAATGPALRYPWAGRPLNAEWRKTLLEWRIANGNRQAGGHVLGITSTYDLLAFCGEVRPQGVLVRLDIARREAIVIREGMKGYGDTLVEVCEKAHGVAMRSWGLPIARGLPLSDWTNLAMDVYLDGKYAGRMAAGQFVGVPIDKAP